MMWVNQLINWDLYAILFFMYIIKHWNKIRVKKLIITIFVLLPISIVINSLGLFISHAFKPVTSGIDRIIPDWVALTISSIFFTAIVFYPTYLVFKKLKHNNSNRTQ